MARDSSGSHNEPVYLGTGAPATAADMNEIVTFAKKYGNARVGTSTERSGLTGADLWSGLSYFETDTSSLYLFTGSAWMLVWKNVGFLFAIAGGVAAFTGLTQNVAKSMAVTFPPGLFTVAPLVSLSVQSATPLVTGASTDAPTTSGFTLYGQRSDSNPTLNIRWTAVQVNG